MKRNSFKSLLFVAAVVVLAACAQTPQKTERIDVVRDKAELELRPTPLTPLTGNDVATLRRIVAAGQNGPEILKILNETGMSFDHMKSVLATSSALLAESQLAKAVQTQPAASGQFSQAPVEIKKITTSGLGKDYETSRLLIERSGLDLSQLYLEGNR